VPHSGLSAVRTVGGLVPGDLLGRVVAGQDLAGLSADDFHLELGVTPREAANRAWSVLVGAWTGYRDALAKLPDGDRATGLTREKWLSVLLRELGFGRVPVTSAGGITVEGRSFPVSHRTDTVPIHLLGWGVDLDRKTPGLAGAADRAPHAMVQELLNRSDQHLWAILANGGTLRLLRDSSNLVGQAYVEFDLEAIFDGQLFSDFVALFLLAHQTRFEPVDPEAGPGDCWLERWRADAVETGARALGQLRDGVKAAIESLGTGFLQHPGNVELRARLEPGGGLDLADYHRALLRLVYRLLFCFVAEDRGLLLDPTASDIAKARYIDWFSTARLRRIASRRRGTRHADLWQALSLVIDGLGSDDGRPELGLPGIGGLFEHGPVDVVTDHGLANDALLAAVRHLCVIQPKEGGPRRNVDYQHLGAEELGGIYESLLELVPRHEPVTRTFTLETLAGNERKTSGAYYTPTSLIESLLESALDPLLDEAGAADDPETALLALTVCDPACGSGHFLVAAARRIAQRLAYVRAGDGEPSIILAQDAMHDVVARCIYGVDLNPMAAELAKVSLWLESLSAGRPLGFLDHHIKIGNALLGTTPALLAAGVPEDAFAALEGDDKKVVAVLKKRNRAEQSGQDDLFAAAGITVDNRRFAEVARGIDALAGLDLSSVHLAEKRQRELENSPELAHARFVADAWCAAFVAPKVNPDHGITDATVRGWAAGSLPPFDDPRRQAVERVSTEYRFFHWHLEYPQIFAVTADAGGPGLVGGFSCVLGNPPWEHVELKEQEYFAARDAAISTAPGAERKRRIDEMLGSDSPLAAEYRAAKRRVDGERLVLGSSGRYPLCGRGRINTYAVFAEHDRAILGPSGRLGVILPMGIATDATTQAFFRSAVTERSLVSLYHFENEGLIFENVHHAFKFCLLVLAGRDVSSSAADFAFFARKPADLDRPGARFSMTPEEIQLLNPNTATCPVFRSRRDAELMLAIYRRVPILIHRGRSEGNPWGASFIQGMFNMTSDSHLFHNADQLEAEGWTLEGNRYRRGPNEMIPLYEGKMVHHFDHRWATFEPNGVARDVTSTERSDPTFEPLPRYWVASSEVSAAIGGREAPWYLGFRDICRSTDERTMIATQIAGVGVGHKLPLILSANRRRWTLAATLPSFVLDFAARQKVGGTSMSFFIVEQLPVPTPAQVMAPLEWTNGSFSDFIKPRVVELVYTGWGMQPFALELGDEHPPFRWDEYRRAVLRAEIDAACFHLYGVDTRDDVDYILGTFSLVNRRDLERRGEERTRRLILESYDRMADATRTGTTFQSSLDPAPGCGPRHDATMTVQEAAR